MAVYEFGCFSLNVAQRLLLRRRRPLKLPQRLFNVLTMLVENSGRVITKEELIQTIWPETIVEESNLTVAIAGIRMLLGDDARTPRYIATLPRRGYRFIADVRHVTDADANSVAVLPFAHDDNSPDTEYFADRLTESLIYTLSSLGNLKVVPRSSVLRYKRKQVDPVRIAARLGVDALVNGRINQQGQDFIISVELLRGGCEELVWGKQYYCKGSDSLVTQHEITRRIIETLNPEMWNEGRVGVPTQVTPNNEVYRLYLRGRFHWHKRSQGHLRKSIDYFKQAIRKDPACGLAYTGLADSYNMLGFYSMMAPRIAFTRAKAASLKALAIDDSIAEAHASHGFAIFHGDWNWKGAEYAFRQSIQLDANCLSARLYYGCFLAAASRFDEATQQYKRALEIDPLSLIANAALGYGYYFARRYDEAIAQCKATIELDEHFEAAHLWLGWALEGIGSFDEAIVEYEKALNLSGGQTSIFATLGAALALDGRQDEARQMLQELANLSRQAFLSPYHTACIYVALGDKEKAFECLQKAYRNRSHLLVNLQVDPKLDSLRSDPRFGELIVRIVPANYSTHSDEARRSYQVGRYYWSYHTRGGLEQAVQYFNRATELDPHYLSAYAAAIDCYLRLSSRYFLPGDSCYILQPAAVDNLPAEKQASLTRYDEWDAATAALEVKWATDIKCAMPNARHWHAAYVFCRDLYEKTLDDSRDVCGGADEIQESPAVSELSDHRSLINFAGEIQIACLVTRRQIEVGNIEAAYLVLSRWYRLGEWPRLEGLSPHLSADLLLTAGILSGRLASTRLLPRGQKHAEALLNGAISLFEQISLRHRAAEARSELGRCYDREGMVDLARAQFLLVLQELPPEYPELISRTLLRLAFTEMKVGHLHDALTRLNEASEIVRSVGSSTVDFYHIEMATTLGELAIAEHSCQYLEKACLHYRQALANSEAFGHVRRIAVLENNHGYLMRAFGRFQEAESALKRAQAMFRHLSDPCPQLDETLASFHLEAGRLDLAEKKIIRSISKLETAGEDALLAESLRTQGRILCKLGRYREGKRVLDRAYQIAKTCGDGEGAGLALLITIEELSEHLDYEEGLGLVIMLRRLLGQSQRTSVVARLQKCAELVSALKHERASNQTIPA